MRILFLSLLLPLFLTIHVADKYTESIEKYNPELSPFNQHLPNCNLNKFNELKKKSSLKAIVCPMVKDEEGFLSEWLAFYKIMGFDHVMLFDDGSTDNGLNEIKPWIESGFVSVHQNWSIPAMKLRGPFLKSAFKKAMAVKATLETTCKLKAIEWGYDIMVSLDLDEYVIPQKPGITFVDAFEEWMNTTGRPSYCIPKYNFQSTPHILEPGMYFKHRCL